MNINTLLTNYAQNIAIDVDIKAWCNVTYGRNHKVYINYDERDRPGENDAPFVAIYPINKTVGQTIRTQSHGFELVCGIYDESVKVHAETNITEYEGVQRIEIFRKLVEDAIIATDIGNARVDKAEIDYETIETFPFMLALMDIEVINELTLGSEPME